MQVLYRVTFFGYLRWSEGLPIRGSTVNTKTVNSERIVNQFSRRLKVWKALKKKKNVTAAFMLYPSESLEKKFKTLMFFYSCKISWHKMTILSNTHRNISVSIKNLKHTENSRYQLLLFILLKHVWTGKSWRMCLNVNEVTSGVKTKNVLKGQNFKYFCPFRTYLKIRPLRL